MDLLETDICVIGAGPAGISFAHACIGTAHRVVLLEGGWFEADDPAQRLARGTTESHYYSASAIADGRRRQFGGTSNLWVYRTRPDNGRRYARSLPPEAIDFEARDVRSDEGWPFPLGAMRPFHERAQRFWNGGPFDYEMTTWAKAVTAPVQFRDNVVMTRMCQHGPLDVFMLRYRDELLAAENVTIHLGCTALELEWQPSRARVQRVKVARADGSRFSIASKVFVLAGGGVENVQLLLLSEATQPGGPANRHDNVGRFVTDHPEFCMGTVTPADNAVLDRIGLYDLRWVDGFLLGAFLTLTEEVKRHERLLNMSVALVPRPLAFGSAAHRSLASLLAIRRFGELPSGLISHLLAIIASPRDTMSMLSMRSWPYREFSGGWSRPGFDSRRVGRIEVYASTEQTPHRDNQISLAAARDRLGRRQVHFRWHWSESDRQNIERSLNIFAAQIERARLGRFRRWIEFDGAARPFLSGFHHPMGGTRMHTDPRHGVVDENCLVHGTANLYVAGSSVFPTGHGYANPTLSIIALTIRLADHVKTVLV